MRIELTEYVNLNHNRTAKVIKTANGYEADFFENNKFVATRKLHQYTEEYAQDACENWVEKIIDTPDMA